MLLSVSRRLRHKMAAGCEVGFVGLGAMGYPMAGRMAKECGFSLLQEL